MDYIELAALAIVLAGAIGFMREIRMVRIQQLKNRQREEKEKATKLNLSNMMEGIPMAIDHLHKMRTEMIKGNATPEQLLPIDKRLQQLQWIQQNQWWIQPVIPIAEKGITAIFKMVGAFK